METLRLEFQPKIRAKLLELLSSFSSDELKIEQEDPDFDENKRKLDISLAKVENGTAECCSLDELDLMMDEIFSEYDNRIK
ncbi:hypothetical protein [Flavobacterium laiguense]|uniref:Uncharacterized protein n=1 Tax=Flavobacterium laiguense TaxID=2169409 RepID=A0A2U1K1P8_9FLAO|nr:hypothetical protein [Flavobacterium laiguense]PWA10888.1 hypothetical protein DB891_03415 [Flavobacterium laiguense]